MFDRHRNLRRICGNERCPGCAMIAPIREGDQHDNRYIASQPHSVKADRPATSAAAISALRSTPKRATKSEPSICRNTGDVFGRIDRGPRPDFAHLGPTTGFRAGARRGIVAIDLTKPRDQAGHNCRPTPTTSARMTGLMLPAATFSRAARPQACRGSRTSAMSSLTGLRMIQAVP